MVYKENLVFTGKYEYSPVGKDGLPALCGAWYETSELALRVCNILEQPEMS